MTIGLQRSVRSQGAFAASLTYLWIPVRHQTTCCAILLITSLCQVATIQYQQLCLTFIFSQFWKAAAQDQGVSIGYWQGLFQRSLCYAVSTGLFLWVEVERALCCPLFSYMDTGITDLEAQILPSPPYRLCFQKQTTLEAGHINFRGYVWQWHIQSRTLISITSEQR